MPEEHATARTAPTFTDDELDALRGIVTDWINERIAEPPYPADFDSVIQKLGLAA